MTSRYRKWCFTINKPIMDDYPKILEFCKKYIYQLELGESGTLHLQGCLELTNNKTMSALSALLPKAHLEVCKNWQAAIKYCQKLETRADGPWAKGIKLDRPLKLISKFLPWQQEIIDLLKSEADDRTIHWYWEKRGCSGKTALAKYLCSKYNGIVVSGKAADVYYGVAHMKHLEDLIVIFDVARSDQEVSYLAMEKVKDGLFFSGKFKSGMCIFNCPHLIVFANFPPMTTKLSLDRWHIVEVPNDVV